jgi:cyclic pyranopterin phosphate synthase
MPEKDYVWLPRADILDFEEVGLLVDVFAGLGVDRVRLTGGEPLVRRNLAQLVRLLASKPRIKDLAMTTNGVLLAEQAGDLAAAGLHRVTVSLDTLRADRFRAMTRFDELGRVLAGIAAASEARFAALKIDTVVIRETNDDELVPILEYGGSVGAEVRFIEYMDVGGATRWSREAVVPSARILEQLGRYYGSIEPLVEESSAPAVRFRLPDGRVFGLISSMTSPFCGSCDRSRLTADGMWYLCLYASVGIDLRRALRAGMSEEELRSRIENGWRLRADRGAEQRLALHDRSPLLPAGALREDPHLEMHTRGG